ncbi:MAG: RNA methyltransferase [Paludibacter sp.]|nr:RNA methyltransferase [Paludibacter sp.]
MLSKNKIKLITSLAHKKYRDETGLFIAEGTKLVSDLATTFHCELLVIATGKESISKEIKASEKIVVDEDILTKLSTQKNPQGVLGLFRKRDTTIPSQQELANQLVLALDDIQDPGNLGTIIRLADWFGIKNIFCSELTADAYGPKVVQASMGALTRVNLHYVNLPAFLSEMKNIPVYGTFLKGKNIYSEKLSKNGIIVMGNEGNGISSKIEKLVTNKLLIPNFPADAPTSESLNVAVATAIVCSEFRRKA